MSTSNHPFLEFPQIKHPFLMMGKTIKWSPNTIEVAPSCPRCFSSNTKFCYYNNYSVSQPRYFCKACRRYWTKGGSLRNVPIGGGCRKGRRGRSASRYECPLPRPAAAAAAAVGPTESGGDDARDRRDHGGVSAASAKHDDILRNVVVKDYECGGSSSVGVIDGGDEKLQQVHGCLDGRDFVYENFDVFEVEGIGLGSEMMWSNFEGFGCEQPLMEMQEFEVFSSDENLVTDNWGSFDPSAYENF